MRSRDLDETSYIRRQKIIIVVIITAAILLVIMRLRLHPGYNPQQVQTLYDELCVQMQNNGDGIELFKQAKHELRVAGTKPDVLFLFQFTGIYAGKIEAPAKLIETDTPIRHAVMNAQFDTALNLVNQALVRSDEMTAGRAKAWGKLIRELQARWHNDCHKPAEALHASPANHDAPHAPAP